MVAVDRNTGKHKRRTGERATVMELHGRDGQNVAINRDHTDHCTVREQERLWDAGRPLRLIAVTLISHRITTLQKGTDDLASSKALILGKADASTGPSRALCYILGGAH